MRRIVFRSNKDVHPAGAGECDPTEPNIRMLLLRIKLMLLLLCGGATTVSAAEGAISDCFTPGNQERKAGEPLNDETTEQGGAVWFANKGYILAAAPGDGGVTPATEEPMSAQVSLPAGCSRLEVEAAVVPSAAKSGWWGVGFSGTKSKNDSNWKGGAFLIADSDGWARLFADGMRIAFKIKKIPGFQKGAPIKLRLAYDRGANTLSAWANGEEVIANHSFNAQSYQPGMLYAGFSSYGLSKEATLDNFSLKYAPPQSAPEVAAKEKPSQAYRILFLGNSITRHGASEKLGWNHVAGMAASSEEKDFAHLVTAALAQELGDRKVEPFIKGYGGGVVSAYVGHKAEYQQIQPDLVVIQLGENDREAQGLASFSEQYQKLLDEVSGLKPSPVVLCTGVWQPGGSATYSGWAAQRENAIKTLAQQYGAQYVSVAAVAADPECHGFGENPGVRWHPNDKGMQGYANGIMHAWRAAKHAAAKQ